MLVPTSALVVDPDHTAEGLKTDRAKIWRLAVHPFVFTNSTELLLGELLLYYVGVGVER
jgi:hypothetical protein